MHTKQKIEVVLQKVFLSCPDHRCCFRKLNDECHRLGFDDATVLKGIRYWKKENKVIKAGSLGFRWVGGDDVDI